MSRLLHRLLPVGFALLLCPASVHAGPVTIDFEALADLSSVGTFYSGVTFSNATVLEAGTSLNEFEFPPHSGTHVVFDDGDALRIDFDSPVFSVAGFVTYLLPVTLTAFDASNNVVAFASATFASNLALSGAPGSAANELLEVLSATAISYVTIGGDPLGGSFVMDDFTYNDTAPVPEPGTIALFGAGVAALAAGRRRRARVA